MSGFGLESELRQTVVSAEHDAKLLLSLQSISSTAAAIQTENLQKQRTVALSAKNRNSTLSTVWKWDMFSTVMCVEVLSNASIGCVPSDEGVVEAGTEEALATPVKGESRDWRRVPRQTVLTLPAARPYTTLPRIRRSRKCRAVALYNNEINIYI